jgi:acyl-coenzyme A thioesterase PaaI-like protein
VIKSGKTIGLTECDVTDAEGRLVARAMSTCMTLRGDLSEGR